MDMGVMDTCSGGLLYTRVGGVVDVSRALRLVSRIHGPRSAVHGPPTSPADQSTSLVLPSKRFRRRPWDFEQCAGQKARLVDSLPVRVIIPIASLQGPTSTA